MSAPRCTVGRDISLYFRKLQDLGSGSFGQVYAANPTSEGVELLSMKGEAPDIVAIKQLPKSKINSKAFAKEIGILSEITVSSALKYYGCFETPVHYYVIMEYFEGIELFTAIVEERLSESDKAIVVEKIAHALNDLHNSGIVHRDVKPENIMINTETLEIRLIDYGLSCNYETHTGDCDNIVGSVSYLDPQIRNGADKHGLIQADWWSFGQVVYALYVGSNMCAHSSNHQCIYYPVKFSKFPPKIRPMMSLLLDPYATVHPERVRPLGSEIISALK